MLTSQICAHDAPAGCAPASPVPHREHSAGGSAVFRWSGSGSRARPAPGWPGCPPRLRSLRRSRSEESRLVRSALRRSFAPMLSFDVGVPELVLSCPSRRSSSAIRSSIRRRSSRSAVSSVRSIATSASFASATARSRASSSCCSPAPAGRSGTSPDHAQPQLQVQASPTSCRGCGCQRARHHSPACALTLAVGDAVAVRRVLASGRPAAPTEKHPRTFPERPERGPRPSAA